jgi:hypothetical protein
MSLVLRSSNGDTLSRASFVDHGLLMVGSANNSVLTTNDCSLSCYIMHVSASKYLQVCLVLVKILFITTYIILHSFPCCQTNFGDRKLSDVTRYILLFRYPVHPASNDTYN